jgi:hypothetical protein
MARRGAPGAPPSRVARDRHERVVLLPTRTDRSDQRGEACAGGRVHASRPRRPRSGPDPGDLAGPMITSERADRRRTKQPMRDRQRTGFGRTSDPQLVQLVTAPRRSATNDVERRHSCGFSLARTWQTRTAARPLCQSFGTRLAHGAPRQREATERLAVVRADGSRTQIATHARGAPTSLLCRRRLRASRSSDDDRGEVRNATRTDAAADRSRARAVSERRFAVDPRTAVAVDGHPAFSGEREVGSRGGGRSPASWHQLVEAGEADVRSRW